MPFCFSAVFPGIYCTLDTRISFICRTLVRLLPHNWRRVARPKVALRRYRNYFRYNCQLFVFSSLFFFQHMIYLVCLAFRRGFGRAKYYTRPSLLFCQPSVAYSNITPTVSRHSRITYRKLIFLKESSLFLLSALIDLNRSNPRSLPHIHQNTYFSFTSIIFVRC